MSTAVEWYMRAMAVRTSVVYREPTGALGLYITGLNAGLLDRLLPPVDASPATPACRIFSVFRVFRTRVLRV